MNDAAAELNPKREKPVKLDVIIPVYNEEETLEHLFGCLKEIFSDEAMRKNGIEEVNYIMVDDGSGDRSAQMMCEWIRGGAPAVLLRLSRNFGHQSAVCAGLSESKGDVAAVMDADLQDPPEKIIDMLRLWRSGNDVVYGMRRNRKENFIKVFCYWVFYRLLSLLTDEKVPLDSGDFCLMDAAVVRDINAMPEVLRFPRGLRAWVGYRQFGLEYDRPERKYGTTKYGFKKLYALATDGIASLSIKPLKLSQFFSILMALISLTIFLVILWRQLFSQGSGLDLGLMLLLFCVLITSAVQLLNIYILGAYVGRTYLEVKRRPNFIIRQKITGREKIE